MDFSASRISNAIDRLVGSVDSLVELRVRRNLLEENDPHLKSALAQIKSAIKEIVELEVARIVDLGK